MEVGLEWRQQRPNHVSPSLVSPQKRHVTKAKNELPGKCHVTMRVSFLKVDTAPPASPALERDS